jgi:hypothetical protein
MNTLTEIEAAIQKLSETDIRQLSEWIEDYLDEMWDQQLESDLGSGRLDQLIAHAEMEIRAQYA